MTETLETLPEGPSSETTGSSATGAEAAALQCPYCPFIGKTERGLSVHVAHKHKEERPASWDDKPRRLSPPPGAAAAVAGAAPTRSPADLEAIRAGFQEDLQTIGGFAFLFGLQTTGVALDRRAEKLSYQAMVYAQRNESVLKAMQGLHVTLQASELLELLTPIPVAVAFDLGILRPDSVVRAGPVKLSGRALLGTIQEDIQEVLRMRAQAAALQQQAQAAAGGASPNGRQESAA